jgi:hypothetical protein
MTPKTMRPQAKITQERENTHKHREGGKKKPPEGNEYLLVAYFLIFLPFFLFLQLVARFASIIFFLQLSRASNHWKSIAPARGADIMGAPPRTPKLLMLLVGESAVGDEVGREVPTGWKNWHCERVQMPPWVV